MTIAQLSIEKIIFDAISNWYVTTGYIGIVLAMAIESCCIPLPSEIVMPLAGFFVYKCGTSADAVTAACNGHSFSLLGVTIAGTLGGLIGSCIAYAIGASGGRPLLLKFGRYILISQADSDRADKWFARFGAPVAFFSRLLPVIRTYISLPAGISRMNFLQFVIFTVLGSLPWTFALALLGDHFGSQIEQFQTQLSTVFHGLDVVILLALVVGVGLYIYRHIKHDSEARQRSAAASERR